LLGEIHTRRMLRARDLPSPPAICARICQSIALLLRVLSIRKRREIRSIMHRVQARSLPIAKPELVYLDDKPRQETVPRFRTGMVNSGYFIRTLSASSGHCVFRGCLLECWRFSILLRFSIWRFADAPLFQGVLVCSDRTASLLPVILLAEWEDLPHSQVS